MPRSSQVISGLPNGTVTLTPTVLHHEFRRTNFCSFWRSNLMAKDDFKNLGFQDASGEEKGATDKATKGEQR